MPYWPSTQAQTGRTAPESSRDRAGHPGRGGRRGVVGRAGLEQADDLARRRSGSARPARSISSAGSRSASGLPSTVQADGTGTIVSPCEPSVSVVHRADRHAEALGDEVAEPGGVEHAGLADDPAAREAVTTLAASAVISSSGLDDHDQHGVGRVLDDLLGDAAHDLGVDPDQVHPAHAGLARQAGGDDHDVRAGDRLVALAARAGGLAGDLGLEALDRPGLVHVEGQALGLALDDVGQHDLVEDVVLRQPLRGGRAVEARRRRRSPCPVRAIRRDLSFARQSRRHRGWSGPGWPCAACRFLSSAPRNSSVVRNGASLPISSARSLVILPLLDRLDADPLQRVGERR